MSCNPSPMLSFSLGIIAGQAALAADGVTEGLFLYVEVGDRWHSVSLFKDEGPTLRYYEVPLSVSELIIRIRETLAEQDRWSIMNIAIRNGAMDSIFAFPDEVDLDPSDMGRRDSALRRRYGDKPVIYPPPRVHETQFVDAAVKSATLSNDGGQPQSLHDARIDQIYDECFRFIEEMDRIHLHVQVDFGSTHIGLFEVDGVHALRHRPSPDLFALIRDLWEEDERSWGIMEYRVVKCEPVATFAAPNDLATGSALEGQERSLKVRYGDNIVITAAPLEY